jgi:prepilin-type N-terminal cleavage/methylation domain-containing protein
MPSTSRRRAFTLVELLVVIGIIALLISILLPTLNRARWSAQSTANLSNLRQLGIGLEFYRNDHQGVFPRHSSIKGETQNATPPTPRTRWADYIYPYLESEDVFDSPLLDDKGRMTEMKEWAHSIRVVGGALDKTDVRHFGGYGYNFQYLGNSRKKDGQPNPFHAKTSHISASSKTIALADTKGSRDGDDFFEYDEGTYVVDPPLQSLLIGSRGSRTTSADPNDPGNYGYTGGDGTLGTLVPEHRSTPDARNAGNKVAVLFVDGHGELLLPELLDDSDNDEVPDNGLWNGQADPTLR